MKYLNYTKQQLIEYIMELEEVIELLRELSVFDSLTRLNNQRALFSCLSFMIKEAHRIQIPLCVILFDIDDFKKINDIKGHVFGNLVLTCVAEIIKNSIRETDIAGRFGGDEFMLILTNTDFNTARVIADRIRHVVEETFFFDGHQITISGGIKLYDNETLLDFIHAADMNLYKAKQNGKNTIY